MSRELDDICSDLDEITIEDSKLNDLVEELRGFAATQASEAWRLQEELDESEAEVKDLQDEVDEFENKYDDRARDVVDTLSQARDNGNAISLRNSLNVALEHSQRTYGYHDQATKVIEAMLDVI